VKLVPLSAEHLQAHPALPFPVFAADGRLLLPAQASLKDERVQARLRQEGSLFVQQRDYDAWRRGMVQAVNHVLQKDARLSELANARPELVRVEIPAMPGEEWESLVLALDKAMQAPAPDKPWLARALAVHAQLRGLAARRMEEALFHFVYTGGSRTSFYSSRQALRCMLIAGEAARALQWDAERIALLDKAALTMNVASWRLQDRLARHAGAIEDEYERAQIERHPAEGAQMLQDAGVAEPAWLEAVRLHHDDSLAGTPLAELTPGQQIALLLRRVDRYSAMLSRRAGREPLSATQAAQQACLGVDGRPDPIGALMLKAVGLYPPGSFVALASNERGIVLARGERANQPMVAALVNAEGVAMTEPRLRDTSRPNLAVRAALSPGQVPVDPPLQKLQALRVSFK
jgi:HD-GYP domain-containing protein (c-di-GMP phosphodiesterase class II)